MVSDKKFLALVIATAITTLGMVFAPYDGSPSLARYVITGIGQFSIIFVAALIGFERVRSFTFDSALGKSLLFISLGILSWGLGALAWLYYNIMSTTEVPYPSLADVFFVGTVPLAAYGLFLLLRNLQITFDLKTKLKLVLLPLAAFLVVYSLFIEGKLAEDVPALAKALNVMYPLGDAIFLSFTLVLLSLIRGSKMFKPVVLLCMGYLIEAMADFSFSWTTSTGTYYTGNWVDMLFALAFSFIGTGIYFMGDIYATSTQSPKRL